MELKKSQSMKGWVGLFVKDENGYPEEVVAMKKKDAIKFVEDCNKFIKGIKK